MHIALAGASQDVPVFDDQRSAARWSVTVVKLWSEASEAEGILRDSFGKSLSRRADSNCRPAVYETAALPAELRRRGFPNDSRISIIRCAYGEQRSRKPLA